eukprot:6188408-Pleurochrysis_carterae.AAC.1
MATSVLMPGSRPRALSFSCLFLVLGESSFAPLCSSLRLHVRLCHASTSTSACARAFTHARNAKASREAMPLAHELKLICIDALWDSGA